MKESLVSGGDDVLKVPENVIIEPSKHQYVSEAVQDGEETRPTQYPTMTNQET